MMINHNDFSIALTSIFFFRGDKKSEVYTTYLMITAVNKRLK